MATIPFNAPLNENLVRYLIRALGTRGMGLGMGGMGQQMPAMAPAPAPDAGLRQYLEMAQALQPKYPSMGLQSEMLAQGRRASTGGPQIARQDASGRVVSSMGREQGPQGNLFGYNVGGTGNLAQAARMAEGMSQAARTTPGGMAPLPSAVGPMFPSDAEAKAFAAAVGAVRPDKSNVAMSANIARGQAAKASQEGATARENREAMMGLERDKMAQERELTMEGFRQAMMLQNLQQGLHPETGMPLNAPPGGEPEGESPEEVTLRQRRTEELNAINPPRNIQRDPYGAMTLADLIAYLMGKLGDDRMPREAVARYRENLNRLNQSNPPRNLKNR